MGLPDLEIVILAENSVYQRGLMTEHGLSFWIKYRKQQYLFDTGQGEVLLYNTGKLGLNLQDLSGVF